MIKIKTQWLDGHHQEELEDALKDFMIQQKTLCVIYNTLTCNDLTVTAQDIAERRK